MYTRATGPVLELNKAVPSFDESGLPPVPFSMKLMPGECAIIEVRDNSRATAFADMCSGLVPLVDGAVKFMGLDWADLRDREKNALRGRIGRMSHRSSWPDFLGTYMGIGLQQLHHTTRDMSEVVIEATQLSSWFGLPGLPVLRPDMLSETDLIRASCVRAFLGNPQILLLENLLEACPADLEEAFVGAVVAARNKEAGVIWLVRNNTVQRRYRQLATSMWRLVDDGLVAVRAG
ncbi:ABC transporter ATP-binding protein [Acetobacter thailandicus]|uniref:ABC transporter ATP-binding protein n=1 Tax=Acetobacter thailandicus TaxID=1502842 RepID=A0ABT3QF22_9PROT|nr:ABC transporter ATP-binding protein [Acetobacter thailandicus]MCX2563880.1 ABC transporter ATP-binding protein [Acetobacter thailandicus]NHN95049.1 ABC transporter ATP-binding protein [Acetobacter thailandicus]